MNQPGKTNEQIQEALGILQEECAEVIVEISKCRRFGLSSVHYRTGKQHVAMLEQELGDLLAMIDILIDQEIIDRDELVIAMENKKLKLEEWSKIYEQN
mgnify:CR=1 FL=1